MTSQDPTINLTLDTIKLGKQAIVFANTKASAEKTAEDISKHIKNKRLINLKEQALKALQQPTKQCERLAFCIEKGIAFHHAGLTSKQKDLIETNFKNKTIDIIVATPTLCLSKDTNIWHDISETKVDKFNNSNPIFVLSNNKLISMKAQKIEKNLNSSNLIKISSVSGHSIKVTPNHKMLIKRNNKKSTIQAKDIKKTDKIATIGKLNIENTTNPNIKEFIKKNKIEKNLKFGKKLSYFIGSMLGDGYSGAETKNNNMIYKGSACITGKDQITHLNALEICRKLNLSPRKNIMQSNVPQTILGKQKWFREFLLNCGIEKGENKYISEKLMKMDSKNTVELLKGLFDTDGYVQRNQLIGFSSISEKLVKNIQKLLLRFGIVSRLRIKKEGTMKIYSKEYNTKQSYELSIHQKKCIIDFYKNIGFNLERKQDDLIKLIGKITSNVNYFECEKCKYKIYNDIFSGKSKEQKEWAKTKLEIIKLLGEKGELVSRDITKYLKTEPKKKENRLNHHYELINKRKIGKISKNEWFWSLNSIGKWIYNNLLQKDKKIYELLNYRDCPLCNSELDIYIKKGWRDSDFDGDIFWDIIREIKEVPCENDVYDIVLPNNPKNEHLFVANGFIVHNSIGVDLPAYRVILKDLRRHTKNGLTWIPTLEYLQMSGRAGRPKYDNSGQSIAIIKTRSDKDEITNRYIYGQPEDIFSKLAVEPVLRTYTLSLISTGYVKSKEQLLNFFEKTFWAYQFQDMDRIEQIIDKMIELLDEYNFIKIKNNILKPTPIGKRVSELYIDPLTANQIITALRKASTRKIQPFAILQMVTSTLEMRPLLRVRMSELEDLENELIQYEPESIIEVPDSYDHEYDDYLQSAKTALMFLDWINEDGEDMLLKKYNMKPGELHAKINNADWLLYASEELTRLLQFHNIIKEFSKLRIRLKYGAKEEILTLLKLKNIGRIRARKLYVNKIKTIQDIKTIDLQTLTDLIGKTTAIDIKNQVGEKIEIVKENKRKGQISLMDF